MDFTEVNVSLIADPVKTVDNQIVLVHQGEYQADNDEGLNSSSSSAAADVHLDLTKMLCMDVNAISTVDAFENTAPNTVSLEVTVTALNVPSSNVAIAASPESDLRVNSSSEVESDSDSEDIVPIPSPEIPATGASGLEESNQFAVDDSKDFEFSTVLGSCREETTKDDDEFAFESISVVESNKQQQASVLKPSSVEHGEVLAGEQSTITPYPRPSVAAEHLSPDIHVPTAEPVSMAANEWAAVQEVTPDVRLNDSQSASDQPVEGMQTQLVAVDEVLSDCRNDAARLTASPDIHTTAARHGFAAFIFRLFGTKMHADLLPDRKLVFGLGACPFSNENKLHHRVLQTLYRKLTGSRFDCPRFGSHWEVIGFQGNDPSTDLRSVGFLGLLQLLFLITDPRTQTLAKQIYKLSLHVTQNFPFCIMGINITRICLQTLREDKLNKICNKHGSVFEPFNLLFAAAFLHMYEVWKTQHKTIADSGFLIRDLDMMVKKHTQSVYNHLLEYLAKEKSGGLSQHASNQSHAAGEPFMTHVTWQPDDDDS